MIILRQKEFSRGINTLGNKLKVAVQNVRQGGQAGRCKERWGRQVKISVDKELAILEKMYPGESDILSRVAFKPGTWNEIEKASSAELLKKQKNGTWDNIYNGVKRSYNPRICGNHPSFTRLAADAANEGVKQPSVVKRGGYY